MSITVRCPHPGCGRTARVADDLAGRSILCAGCERRLRVAPSAAADTAVAGRTAAETPSPEEDTLPTRVGRFEVRARLGAGAFGTVYRAYDPQLQREVAVKVPRATALARPGRRERFLREARAAAQLRHPCIVPVYESGGDGDACYIASAFVAGKPLAAVVGKRPDHRRAARVVRDLAEALAYAHEQGVVHRDVKPDNVLLDDQGRPHLTDFGLAAWKADEERLTREGALLGTPAYMAPEQTAAANEARPAADQYSLGVVLYELLCGALPFVGPVASVLYQALHDEPQPPRRRRPDVPLDLETICLKAMAKRPQDRYASCRDLADDLRRWLDAEPIKARRMGLVERLRRWLRREPRVAAAVLAGVGCVTLLAAVMTGSTVKLVVQRSQERAALTEAVDKADRADGDLKRAAEEAERSAALLKRAEEEAEKRRQAEARALLAAEEARAAQKRAEEALAKLEKETGNTAEARAEAARRRYPQLLDEAVRALGASDFARGRRLLDECPEALRGWEWGYLSLWADRKKIPQRALLDVNQLLGSAECLALAFSPDGQRLAFSHDRFLSVLDAAGGKELVSLPSLPVAPWTAAAFSPDGKLLAASRKGDPAVSLFDAATGRQRGAVRGPGRDVAAFTFSPDGQRLALASGNEVRLFEVATGKEALAFPRLDGVACLAFSPDGGLLAAGGSDRGVRAWETATGREALALPGHTGPVSFLAFSPDGRTILSASGTVVDPTRARLGGGEARLWRVSDGAEVWLSQGWCEGLAFTPDGGRVVAALSGKGLYFLDVTTGRTVCAVPVVSKFGDAAYNGGANRITFAGNGSLAAYEIGVTLDLLEGPPAKK
jgi:WD40 repeat protein/tRNA A-37 threonylcarbamoyl transferase component Bud32